MNLEQIEFFTENSLKCLDFLSHLKFTEKFYLNIIYATRSFLHMRKRLVPYRAANIFEFRDDHFRKLLHFRKTDNKLKQEVQQSVFEILNSAIDCCFSICFEIFDLNWGSRKENREVVALSQCCRRSSVNWFWGLLQCSTSKAALLSDLLSSI